MKVVVTLLVLTVVLVGCPQPKPQPRLAGSVQIIATCTEPGGACETQFVTDLDDNKTFQGFKIDDLAIRELDEAVVNDDLAISFSSPHLVRGFFSGASNPVQAELQMFSRDTEFAEGLESVNLEWKLKIELDDQDQYVLFIDFYRPFGL